MDCCLYKGFVFYFYFTILAVTYGDKMPIPTSLKTMFGLKM